MELTEAGRKNIQTQLETCEAFMKTTFFSSFKKTMQTNLDTLQNSILARAPISDSERSELLMLHGEKAAHESFLTFFEDTCANLKKLLVEYDETHSQRTAT